MIEATHNALHPVFATILTAALVLPVPHYKAKLGRRREFLSQADADAYDRGWAMFPCEVPAAPHTPESQGYFDHEAQAEWAFR